MIGGYTDDIGKGRQVDVRRALVMMRNASLLVRRVDRYFSQANPSQLKFLIMIVIDREPDRTWLYQTEIAEKLDVSKPVLTRTVHALEKAGLLELTPDPKDKRAKRVSLSAAGQTRFSQQLPGYFALITDFMRDIEGG